MSKKNRHLLFSFNDKLFELGLFTVICKISWHDFSMLTLLCSIQYLPSLGRRVILVRLLLNIN